MTSEIESLHFEGHRLAYRVSGSGPAVVVLNLYRRDAVLPRLLSATCQVFEVAPLGFGYSDRVPGYAGERLFDQVAAVLDRYHAGRFVVWGYSAGGAMALCIGRAGTRVAGVVCGGFSPLDFPTPGIMRQMDRRLAPQDPSRSLWWWTTTLDWSAELQAMACPRLLYWGADDRQMARRLRRSRDQLLLQEVDFHEFAALDHAGASQASVLETLITPAVTAWMSRRLGPAW